MNLLQAALSEATKQLGRARQLPWVHAFEQNRELAPPTGRWTIGDVVFLNSLMSNILNGSGCFTEADFDNPLDDWMEKAYREAGY